MNRRFNHHRLLNHLGRPERSLSTHHYIGRFIRSGRTGRSFSTYTYTGRVTQSDRTGRSISVTIDSPSLSNPLSSNHLLPRRHLICHVSNLLLNPSSPDPYLSISDYLSSLEFPLSSLEASLILKSLKYPSNCLEFFNFLPSLPKFKHDCITYNRILHIIARTEDLHLVNNLIDQMEKEGIIGNVSTINILIGVLGINDKCMNFVKKWGIRANEYTYKCLVQAYLRVRDVKLGFRVYEEMRKKGFVLDIFSYNMLLHALVQADMVDNAQKVFDEMKINKCNPDIYTYTILIRMAGRTGTVTGTVPDFISYFDEIISKGIKLNLTCLNTLIQALGKNKMVDKMIFIFSKMIYYEIKPNEFTYSVILETIASEGKINKLNGILEISEKYLNRPIYAFLVRFLNKLGFISEAHNLFCKMWFLYDKGDKNAFICMLNILCKNEKTLEAMDLLNNMKLKGINPDLKMYNILFSSLGKLKQVNDMFQILEKMKNENILPDIFTYNVIISSLGKVGLINEAIELFEEIENNNNIKPDIISYNSFINILGKNNLLDEAHFIFKEMQEKGINPDIYTYSILIECFGKNNKVEMAISLFNQMIVNKCSPNIVTYNILLDILEKNGMINDFYEIYEKLKVQGLNPDLITYSIIEKFEGKNKKRVFRERKFGKGWVVKPL